LIVDDNAINRRLLVEILINWDMNPVAVDSGVAAVETLKEALQSSNPFRLVIVDCMMPDMDGLALVEAMAGYPELAGATVMMLSSAATASHRARCSDLGVAAYLAKPIKQSELLDTILKCLGDQPSPDRQELKPPTICRHIPRELRVLVAEDNPAKQRLVIHLLEREGHSVVIASTGQEAVAAFQQDTFDLVLMDMQMPVMDGFEAAAALRAMERDTGRHTAIIALTAHALKRDRERCLAVGLDGYLSKPLDPGEFWREIERLTGQRHVGAAPLVPTPTSAAMPLNSFGPPSIVHFDVAAALNRSLGDVELLRELLRTFLEVTPHQLELVREAVGSNDSAALLLAAHTLKGSISFVDTNQTYAVVLQTEIMGRDNDLGRAPKCTQGLGHAYGNFVCKCRHI
jgi:CheY-like chemotaxis protein